MKRIMLLWILVLPMTVFSQENFKSLKQDLVGTWMIIEIKVNGVVKSDYDPSVKDEMILREDNTQTTTDKAYEYEQSGTWKIIDGKHFELTDSEEDEKQLLEIVALDQSVLKVKIKQDDTLIEMTMNRK